MEDGKKIVQRLAECGKIMQNGQFSEYDLKYIKDAIEMLLNATNKTITKNIKDFKE